MWPVHGALHPRGCLGAARVCVAAGGAGWAGGRAFCVGRALPPGSQQPCPRLGAFRPPFCTFLYCMLLSNLPRTVCAPATVPRLHPPCGALAHTLNSPPPSNTLWHLSLVPPNATSAAVSSCCQAVRLLLRLGHGDRRIHHSILQTGTCHTRVFMQCDCVWYISIAAALFE